MPQAENTAEVEETVEVELEEEQSPQVEQDEKELDTKDAATEDASDDDLEGYSDKVKKRIEKLTYKMREAERRDI